MSRQLFTLIQTLINVQIGLPGMVNSGPPVIGDRNSMGTPIGLKWLLDPHKQPSTTTQNESLFTLRHLGILARCFQWG